MQNDNVLIVHAHPEPKSFVSSMKDTVVATLERQGANIQESDLYGMAFNPVASSRDFQSRRDEDYLNYALEQRNAVKSRTLAPDIQQELDKVLWADLVVFCFPVYWFSVPAILKGWIDRVMVSGLCYGGKRIYDQGGLRGKPALPVFALGGQDHMFGKGSIHGDLEFGMLRHFLQGTLGYLGFDVAEPVVGWRVPYISDEDRNSILVTLRTAVENLEDRARLPMPSTRDFGPRFEKR